MAPRRPTKRLLPIPRWCTSCMTPPPQVASRAPCYSSEGRSRQDGRRIHATPRILGTKGGARVEPPAESRNSLQEVRHQLQHLLRALLVRYVSTIGQQSSCDRCRADIASSSQVLNRPELIEVTVDREQSGAQLSQLLDDAP